MSAAERLFVVAPVGTIFVLVDADRVARIASLSEAEATDAPRVDLGRALSLGGHRSPRAIDVSADDARLWLIVDRGLRFERLAPRPIPSFLDDAGAPLRGVARLADDAFAFELDLEQLGAPLRAPAGEPRP